MPASDTALPLRVGARTLGSFQRRLVRLRITLAEALDGWAPDLPPLAPDDDGYLLSALPEKLRERLTAASGLRPFVRQSYRRSYARLDLGFDAYLAGISAKSRSTLKRKVKKLAERSGGGLDVRRYRTESQIADFHRDARLVSARTYQERLLDSGLPAGEDALAGMRALARRDQLRGWLLYLEDRPVSYLYAPAEGDTLVYAHLGYDPDFAEYSPGTVLQFEAMRQLMDESRFRLFDFTEGEGQHKRLFATDEVDCSDLMLLRPTLANLAIGHGLAGFDSTVAAAKRMVVGLGATKALRGLRR